MIVSLVEEQNALKPGENFNHEPEFNFVPISINRSSPRRRSNGTKRSNSKNEKVARAAKVGEDLKKFKLKLQHILPLEIHARLLETQYECIAHNQSKDKKCNSKAQKRHGDVHNIFQKIEACDIKTNYIALFEQLQRLVETAMCGTHIRVASRRMKETQELVSEPSQVSKDILSEFHVWLNIISNNKIPSRASEAQDSGSTISTDLTSKPHTARTELVPLSTIIPIATVAVATVRLTTSFISVPYQPKRHKNLPISTALNKVINEPLKLTDLKEGFIYVFWEVGDFGNVKIGRTNDLESRLYQWNRRCNRSFTYHPATKTDGRDKIPHVSRIERLIHMELRNCRRSRRCDGCDTNHKEWFNVPETHVVKVFQKWQKWILEKPYSLDPVSNKWTIRPEMMDKVEEVCKPVLEEVKPLISHSKKGKKTKSGKRSSRRITL